MPQTAITPKKLDSLGLSHSKLNERYMSMERIQETEKDTDSEDDVDDDDDDDDDIAKSVDDDNLESVSQRGDTRNYNGYVFKIELIITNLLSLFKLNKFDFN